jgi:two-component system, chemotaxis family, protein-glutamate methylesterase/glutaminase
MSRIRVMIVEDSAVTRELLKFIIGNDPRLEVVAALESAEEALNEINRLSPDVISMDIRLPGMNGLDATKVIMTEKPTPIVVVAGNVNAEDMNISINALRAGALSVVEKPVGVSNKDYEIISARICTQLVIMSQVKVLRQRQKKDFLSSSVMPKISPLNSAILRLVRSSPKVLGIVASTGGPNAVVRVLNGLGAGFPLPILLVQHITPSFLDSFVSWLGTTSPFKAVVARHGDVPVPGSVYVGPQDRHLCLDAGVLKLDASEAVSFQRPSGTVLLESMARSLGPNAIGILLTGMGDDGAKGLAAIRAAGGYTFAEDQSTAVVYGMPAEAARLNAVCEQLPLHEIAGRVMARLMQPETL